MTHEIETKVATLRQLTHMEISVAYTSRLVKITDKRGRDVLGIGWKTIDVALCHIDTAITFTVMNRGYEKICVPPSEEVGTQGRKGA